MIKRSVSFRKRSSLFYLHGLQLLFQLGYQFGQLSCALLLSLNNGCGSLSHETGVAQLGIELRKSPQLVQNFGLPLK